MTCTTIFIAIVCFVAVGIIFYFLGNMVADYYQSKINTNKQLIYVSTLKVSYCGVGGLITSFTLSYDDDTYEKSLVSKQKLLDVAQKTYERLNSISDKELVNIENYLVIAKDKFIATEIGSYTKYK